MLTVLLIIALVLLVAGGGYRWRGRTRDSV
jgi:hypothetical protein